MTDLLAKGLGWREFQENIDNINASLIDPHTGMVQAMRLALESTIIPEIRRNIHDQFDTSGDFPSRVDVEIINQYRADLVVRAVYAAVHEYGGTFEITPRQRGFFWYMFSTTQDSMWKALALSDTYTIPARPYFRPAILSEQRDAYEVMGEELYDIIAKAVN